MPRLFVHLTDSAITKTVQASHNQLFSVVKRVFGGIYCFCRADVCVNVYQPAIDMFSMGLVAIFITNLFEFYLIGAF